MLLPPPPPVSSGPRPRALFDTECFPNYWLLKLRPIGGHTYSYSIRDGQAFGPQHIAEIKALFESYCVIGFNSLGYDQWMLCGVLAGFTTEQLKWLNDQMIVHKVKPWELGLSEWRPVEQIDIMPVCPGAGSQNAFAARVHHHTIEDFKIDFSKPLSDTEMVVVDQKCENDLGKLEALYDALRPQIRQRQRIGDRYGINVMSKSDAQVGEAILRKLGEDATGRRIYSKRIHEIDWRYQFQYDAPAYLSFETPQLKRALEYVRRAVFGIQPPAQYRDGDEKGRCIIMPPELEGLEIRLGNSVYAMGIGGLHSQEKRLVVVSNDTHQVLMPDVRAYYPNLMVTAGAWPEALGPQFVSDYESIKIARETAKAEQQRLEANGIKSGKEYEDARTDNEGGKIGINGPFGKTGSPFSILWAPKMLIQTTLTGQLSLLMLIEWHELYGMPVVSANTDGLVIYCPRDRLHVSQALIAEWERRSGLTMETVPYRALYARDVNNYFAIDDKGDVKRKGEYAKTSLKDKKAPDVEICADAVSDFLSKGVPIEQTIRACHDIRKFVTIQKVTGGGVKMWGEGVIKGTLVRDMASTLTRFGWAKVGRKMEHPSMPGRPFSPGEAYGLCFAPQRPEYLGKEVRWYYGTRSPGPILYASNGNTVGNSEGAMPCMRLPDVFPNDVDYAWYENKARAMLRDVGYSVLQK